jgi:hypothetical protein
LAPIVLGVVLVGAILAFAYGDIAAHLGYPQPLSELLGPKNDIFADFFTVLSSFPGSDRAAFGSFFGLFEYDFTLPDPNPYFGAGGLLGDPYLGLGSGSAEPVFTHLHLAPLTMAFCQVALRAMQATGGIGMFVICYASLAAYWIKVAFSGAENWREGAIWSASGLLSYPMIFAFTRGNFYAGLAGVLLIHAMLLASRRQAPVFGVILLAVAVNIRPNAILFALPIILFYWPSLRRILPVFVLTGWGIFLASLALANWLYPDYNLGNFRGGLEIYYQTYVVGKEGLAFGSTLYGGLKFLIGYHPGLDFAALVPSVFLLILGAWAWLTQRVSDAAFLFLTAAAYCLGSSVLTNYHLLVFLGPVMIAGQQAGGRVPRLWMDRIAVAACCLILIAKNAFFRTDMSFQTVLNPAILLVGGIAVLAIALRQPHAPWRPRLYGELPAVA